MAATAPAGPLLAPTSHDRPRCYRSATSGHLHIHTHWLHAQVMMDREVRFHGGRRCKRVKGKLGLAIDRTYEESKDLSSIGGLIDDTYACVRIKYNYINYTT